MVSRLSRRMAGESAGSGGDGRREPGGTSGAGLSGHDRMGFLSDFGKAPLCNHRPDRGIFIHGFCLPLCARCTGLLLGSIAGTVLICLGRLSGAGSRNGHHKAAEPGSALSVIRVATGICLMLPTAVDGIAEYATGTESTNRRRLLSGLLAGAGCAWLETGLFTHVLLLQKSRETN